MEVGSDYGQERLISLIDEQRLITVIGKGASTGG